MEKKYELTDEILEVGERLLHRIKALRDFGDVRKSDIGGWIESEYNLSYDDDCWVYGEAKVYDDAEIYGNAKVCDFAEVFGEANVYAYAEVNGCARVCGVARVEKKSDYIVFKNWWSSGRYFTWTRSNDMWTVGCFYGTGEELIKKAYADSEESGREYERFVKLVESIKQEFK